MGKGQRAGAEVVERGRGRPAPAAGKAPGFRPPEAGARGAGPAGGGGAGRSRGPVGDARALVDAALGCARAQGRGLRPEARQGGSGPGAGATRGARPSRPVT